MKKKPKVFIIDVDGVMTDGKLYYTIDGKIMKVFGPDDHDGLSILKPHIDIRFVTGDHRGFPISKKRIVTDMKMPLKLVSTINRIDWIKRKWDPKEVIYMGDGIFDHYVFKHVGYSIAPANAYSYAKQYAHHVTVRKGADRAVAEACFHILRKFFTPYKPNLLPDKNISMSGKWTA